MSLASVHRDSSFSHADSAVHRALHGLAGRDHGCVETHKQCPVGSLRAITGDKLIFRSLYCIGVVALHIRAHANGFREVEDA